jgi:hypothetical protein
MWWRDEGWGGDEIVVFLRVKSGEDEALFFDTGLDS